MNGAARAAEAAVVRLAAGEIAAAMKARMQAVHAQADFGAFAIDSRSVVPGALFFALRGPNRDGHDYIAAAIAAGAGGIVVSREDLFAAPAAGADIARFLVADTTRALQDLAASVRGRLSPVVGITGSAGKTTAKEMTGAALARRRPTGWTAGNLNNLYGLPLTMLNIPAGMRAAVLEMGMSHPGELARLAEIADPDVGVILNVREVHLGNFSSIEEIAEAKGELFRGMRPTATAVWNAADPWVRRLADVFPGPKVSFAAGAPADIVAQGIEDDIVTGARFRLRANGFERDVRLSVFGRHNVENALAALAVARALGDDLDEAASAVASVRAAPMRGETHRLEQDVLLVDDSYNSNPAAMASVLASMSETAWTGRRVLVAGDMLELGPRAAAYHRQVGEHAARAGAGLLIAVGPMAEETAAGASRLGLGAGLTYPDAAAAAAAAADDLAPGDLVVVKGSRGIGMETYVAAVKAAFGRPGAAGRAGGLH